MHTYYTRTIPWVHTQAPQRAPPRAILRSLVIRPYTSRHNNS